MSSSSESINSFMSQASWFAFRWTRRGPEVVTKIDSDWIPSKVLIWKRITQRELISRFQFSFHSSPYWRKITRYRCSYVTVNLNHKSNFTFYELKLSKSQTIKATLSISMTKKSSSFESSPTRLASHKTIIIVIYLFLLRYTLEWALSPNPFSRIMAGKHPSVNIIRWQLFAILKCRFIFPLGRQKLPRFFLPSSWLICNEITKQIDSKSLFFSFRTDNDSNRTVRRGCKSIKSNWNLLPDCRLFIADSLHHGSLHLCFVENELLDSFQKLPGPVADEEERHFCRAAKNGRGSSFLNAIALAWRMNFRLNIWLAFGKKERWENPKLDVNFKVN